MRRLLPTFGGLLALTLLVATPSPALAQPKDAHARAEDQFRRGRELQTKKDYKRALDLFRESQALEPGRGKLLNMALCEQELGLFGSALKHFQELAPQLPPEDERVPIVKQHITELARRAPFVRVDLGGAASSRARVKVDGALVPDAALAAELPVDPGKHVVVASIDGGPEARYDVEVAEAQHKSVHVEGLGHAPAVEAAPVPEASGDGPSTRRVAGFVVGGVGAAALVVGVITGAVALSDHASAVAGCPTHANCSLPVLDQASEGKALSAASTAMFVVGAAGVAAGAVLAFTTLGEKSKSTVGLSVAPGGVRLIGSF
jgi:hypothetical protein